jgi:hypothetical protein
MRKPRQIRAAASKGAAVKPLRSGKKEPQISFGRTGVIDFGVDGPRKKQKPRKLK